MSASDCIFCKIVAGGIPALRVLETADALAFLDIGPLSPGHMLLIPKVHFTNLFEMPPDVLARLVEPLPRLAAAVLKASGASGVNILQNNGASSGQVVMHFHIHLIPRREGDGLGYRWNSGKYGAGQAEAMRVKLIEILRSAS